MRLPERAARFIYLNRYCFNGVYRTNRRGLFNVPRGIKTGKLPSLEEFRECSRCLNRADVLAADFFTLALKAKRGDFFYLDPPYPTTQRPTHGECGYGSFSSADLPRLIHALQIIDRKKASFVLSYAANAEACGLPSVELVDDCYPEARFGICRAQEKLP